MADYTSPKPIDPLWYRMDCYINAQCACGRRASMPVADVARRYRIHRDTSLHKILFRLRCSACGATPSGCPDVTRHPKWR